MTAFDECSFRAIEQSKRSNTTLETCCWGNGGYVENGTTRRKPWYGNKITLPQVAQTLYKSPLEFHFIRECMKINKMRSNLYFSKKIHNKNDSTCVCVMCFTLCLLLEPFGGRFIEF